MRTVMHTRFLPVVVCAALLAGCAAKEEAAPSAPAAPIDPAAASPADDAQFNQWLKGLKGQ